MVSVSQELKHGSAGSSGSVFLIRLGYKQGVSKGCGLISGLIWARLHSQAPLETWLFAEIRSPAGRRHQFFVTLACSRAARNMAAGFPQSTRGEE